MIQAGRQVMVIAQLVLSVRYVNKINNPDIIKTTQVKHKIKHTLKISNYTLISLLVLMSTNIKLTFIIILRTF